MLCLNPLKKKENIAEHHKEEFEQQNIIFTMFGVRVICLLLMALRICTAFIAMNDSCDYFCTWQYKPICGAWKLDRKDTECSFLNECLLELRNCLNDECKGIN
uniref:Kazal-like domain-containing protein n=1 Tax=Glossina austeni TaxID=7395 RepID=A0A1A9V8P1_GLOAU